MPKKIREIKAILSKAGFVQLKKRGKGSHQIWEHVKLPEPIVIGSIPFGQIDRYP
jgi:predicted RNA binding protein YcfA (HicA-like mRNA interferase family)